MNGIIFIVEEDIENFPFIFLLSPAGNLPEFLFHNLRARAERNFHTAAPYHTRKIPIPRLPEVRNSETRL